MKKANVEPRSYSPVSSGEFSVAGQAQNADPCRSRQSRSPASGSFDRTLRSPLLPSTPDNIRAVELADTIEQAGPVELADLLEPPDQEPRSLLRAFNRPGIVLGTLIALVGGIALTLLVMRRWTLVNEGHRERLSASSVTRRPPHRSLGTSITHAAHPAGSPEVVASIEAQNRLPAPPPRAPSTPVETSRGASSAGQVQASPISSQSPNSIRTNQAQAEPRWHSRLGPTETPAASRPSMRAAGLPSPADSTSPSDRHAAPASPPPDNENELYAPGYY